MLIGTRAGEPPSLIQSWGNGVPDLEIGTVSCEKKATCSSLVLLCCILTRFLNIGLYQQQIEIFVADFARIHQFSYFTTILPHS